MSYLLATFAWIALAVIVHRTRAIARSVPSSNEAMVYA